MQLDFPIGVDFDDDEDIVTTTVAPVRSEVTAPPPVVRHEGARDLLAGDSWEWTDVRDYVRRMIAETTRAHYSLDPMRETSTYKGFVNRYGGVLARRILVFAFETQSDPGWWKNAPITPTRLCKGADKYFSEEIVAKLNA